MNDIVRLVPVIFFSMTFGFFVGCLLMAILHQSREC